MPNNLPPSDRRALVRWDSAQQAPCHLATLQNIVTCWADVVDISGQGVGLVVTFAPEVGQQIVIELPCKNPQESRMLTARVVRVQQEKGGWRLGCRFSQPVADSEFQSLLEK